MEWLVVGVVLVGAVLATVWGLRRGRTPLRPSPRPWSDEDVPGHEVVLDVDDADPDDPAVQRLVGEVGRRVLRATPDLETVAVYSRSRTLLGRVERPEPLPDIDVPAALHEPHVHHDRTPSPVPKTSAVHPHRPDDIDVGPPVAHRPFAERFDLPERVRDRLEDPDSAVDLVRSIIEASGREVVVGAGLLRVEDIAIVVVAATRDSEEAALNDAFHRVTRSGATRAIVIHLGFVNPEAIRRREAAAPHVRHLGTDAIQRMADAAAVGADPVAFAIGPRLRR